MKIYGVYTQYSPQTKYEQELESLWSTMELALAEAKRLRESGSYAPYDDVWVLELNVDSPDMFQGYNMTNVPAEVT